MTGEPLTQAAPREDGRTFTVAEPSKPSATRSVIGWVLTVLIALGVTIGVKTWLFQVYSIPSSSMEHTLEIDDRVVVSKLNRDPGRGDIVVFERPANDPKQSPDDPDVLIKRVIGLSGETVELRNGAVYVNGTELREDYLEPGTVTLPRQQGDKIVVPEGEILVMGDNREVSQDGRVFGPVPKDLIVGRAILRIWPFSRFGSL